MNKIYNDFEIIELHSKGLTDKEIAEILVVNPNNLARKRNRLGLKPNKNIRETYILTKEELEIICGTLLGDSTIRYVHKGCKFPNLTFTHGLNQREYFDFLSNKLVNLKSSVKEYDSKYIRTNREIAKRLVFTGKNMKCLVDIYNSFYPDNKKIIPMAFVEKYFTKRSLYYLFMDDGSYDVSKNSYIINTQCFSYENLQEFVSFLFKKFNLEFNIKTDRSLYLKHVSNDIMYKILSDNNECDSMKYKYGDSHHKTPLNKETPEKDNLVLNPQEIEEKAKRLEVMPNEKDGAIKSSTKAGHCSK